MHKTPPIYTQTKLTPLSNHPIPSLPPFHKAKQLPPLHKQEMHSPISQHQEHSPKNRKSNSINPQSPIIKPKRAKYRSTRHLNIQAVLVIDQTKRADFIDDQALEGVVEDRQLVFPVSP